MDRQESAQGVVLATDRALESLGELERAPRSWCVTLAMYNRFPTNLWKFTVYSAMLMSEIRGSKAYSKSLHAKGGKPLGR
jgi:hypothetical protein